ncbi:putative membrane protein [Allocatelliglobosispora scoriae]|uniref:Putative membrane protein n=1 Tax=Allocatelliglobosispora scoriae TaxID=643052 RepID=A0A841BUQ0_9ACTN|nr:DUF2231 domain-containing protein [Allocatelliglobosispora scoriae]MBB5870472.1 putative membrane protein [Allocatelliglobosispora scoriae]
MFNEINGIPAHPLLVHFAVVFVLLLVVGSVVYALVPFLRKRIGWAVVALAIVAPVCAWFAKEAGESLRAARFAVPGLPANIVAGLDDHQRFGELTEYFSLGLGVATLLLVLVSTARGRATVAEGGDGEPMPKRSTGALIATVGLSIVVVVLAGFTAYYIYKTGDSGAKLVWS